MINPNSPAPDFTLPTQDGSPVSLRDFRGRWLVLYFYPKDSTPGCTIEARNFQRDLAKYHQRNAAIVGVSVDSVKSHKAFCTNQGLAFTLIADTDAKVSRAYDSLTNLLVVKISKRNTFLINPQGIVAKAWTKVSVEGHSTEVLAALDQFNR